MRTLEIFAKFKCLSKEAKTLSLETFTVDNNNFI